MNRPRKKTPTKTSTTKSPSEGMITYAMRCRKGGERRVTVPAPWKVTFGPTIPYKKGHDPESGVWSVRMYDGDKLRAIFTDVESFRDTSIQVLEKRVRSKRQVVEKAAKHGGRSAVVEATIETWVDPDAPDEANEDDQEFLQLDHKTNGLEW